MRNYIELVENVLNTGEEFHDRTGVGTISVFGTRLEWDLKNGFPAVTEKTLAWKSVVSELLWFLSGSTNVNDLRQILHGSRTEGKTIWDANYENQAVSMGYANGNLGPVYGHQWRNFSGIDQISSLIHGLKKDREQGTHGRRHLVSAWNVPKLGIMALPPCHYAFQVYMSKDGGVSLMWHQRSVDVFLGLPFNIASYALLTHILASIVGGYADRLIFTGGDTHIYTNHFEQCQIMCSREELPLPTLKMPELKSLADLLSTSVKDYVLKNYQSHGTIKADMAV